MTRTILFALMCFVLTKVEAQITLGEDWLISAGFDMTLIGDDTFRDPEQNIGLSGANRSWNFSGMQRGNTVRLIARDASEGILKDSFPSADIVFTSTNATGLIAPGSEIYMRKDNDDLLVIGFADVNGVGFLPLVKLADPITFQSSPLAYRGSGSDRNRFRIPISSALLGNSTISGLTDSVAISVVQDINYNVDGWGTVTVNSNAFDALRIKTVTETTQEFEIKLPFLGWTSATPFLPDSFPSGSILTEDISWVVAEFSFPIVQVTLDSVGEANNIQYESSLASGVFTPKKQQPVALTTRQNGTSLEVLSSSNSLNGQGELRVYTSDGREITRQPLGLNQGFATLETQQWPKGVAFLSLWADGKRLVATKRVAITR